MNNFSRVLVVTIVLLVAAPTVAEDAPIYESLSDVSIGRVFFSASQRAHLDNLRGKNTTATSSTTKPRSTSRRQSNPDAAGFIVSSSGKARVYRNGDFVAVSSEPKVEFPDDVAVTRKSSEEAGVADDESD